MSGLLLATTGLHGLLLLLVWVIVALVVLGIIWYVANMFLPHPIPILIVLIVGLILLIWLVDNTA